ncbi:hypothetical protein ONZ45_g17911 [Pleurotus djamor]|nr:hypothetical protein ONZ45_g17911 [Pleurotus djamor]
MARPSDIDDENPINRVSPDPPALHAVLKEVHELLSTKPVEPYDDISAADEWVVKTYLVLGKATLVTVNMHDDDIDQAVPWFRVTVNSLSDDALHVQKALNSKKAATSTKKRGKKSTRNKTRPHLPARFRQKPTPPVNSTTPNQDDPDSQEKQDMAHDEATDSSPKVTRLRTRVIPEDPSSPSERIERKGADHDPSTRNMTPPPVTTIKIGPPRRAKAESSRMIAPPPSHPAADVSKKSREASHEPESDDKSDFPPLDGREPLLVKSDELLEQFKQRKQGNTSFKPVPLEDIPHPGPNDPGWSIATDSNPWFHLHSSDTKYIHPSVYSKTTVDNIPSSIGIKRCPPSQSRDGNHNPENPPKDDEYESEDS